MNRMAFLRELDEVLELEPGTLKGTETLDEVGWTSLAVIYFMTLCDEKFHVALAPTDIANCTTVDHLVAMVERAIPSVELVP